MLRTSISGRMRCKHPNGGGPGPTRQGRHRSTSKARLLATASHHDTMSHHNADQVPLPPMIDRYEEAIQGALRQGLNRDGSFVVRHAQGTIWDGRTRRARRYMPPQARRSGRPSACSGAEAVGGVASHAMPAAVALEFIHNFSLVHDDIQDEDATRRGRKTIWAVWGKRKALAAGNVLRVVADASLQGLIEAGVDSERALAGVSLLTEAYLEMIEGQYLDMSVRGAA